MQLHDSLNITIVWAVSQPKVKPDHNSHHQLVFNRVANPPNQSQMLLSRAAWYNCFNFPRPTPKQLTKQLNTNASAKSSNHKNESHDHCFALPNSHINSTNNRYILIICPLDTQHIHNHPNPCHYQRLMTSSSLAAFPLGVEI